MVLLYRGRTTLDSYISLKVIIYGRMTQQLMQDCSVRGMVVVPLYSLIIGNV
nr:MAG TPA: hypothetical protein [Caudoviricetes sp.]